MDDDKGSSTDLLDRPESDNLPSDTSASAPIGEGVKAAAKTAKDVLGNAKKGVGDGLSPVGGAGSSLSNAMSGMGGAGNSKGAMKGLGGAGQSVDGIKNLVGGAGKSNNTPSMFRSMEGSGPLGRNNTDGDNPSAKDFAKKAGGKTSAGERVQQLAEDAVKTAKDVQNIARSFGGDASAMAALAKEFISHPIATAKRYGRDALYLFGFFFLQFAVVVAILGALFFGIYKVYLASREIIQDPTQVVTQLRVNREMANFLVSAVGQLSYERDLAEQKKSGVAVAQAPPNIPEPETSPETSKMYAAWENAGLASKFLDDYHAKFKPSNGTATTSTDPNQWNLFVSGKDLGPVPGTKAQAFIGLFAEDTTHWNDIYTRAAMKSVASSEFDTASFKLDLPDSENNVSKSRENTTRQLVETTVEPIANYSDNYYECLILGGSKCDELGLGSTGSALNNIDESTNLLGSIRNIISARLLESRVGKDNLGRYVQSIPDQITPETSTYDTKATLAGNVRTGSSDTILRSIEQDADGGPSADALIELYDRFKISLGNENFARVNYDRESRQSVALSENYFIAGGQLLNNEMGLLDSWALSENLSVISDSSIFQASVIGNPFGVFAQSSSDVGFNQCQKIYNDLKPVGQVGENVDRGVLGNSCFRRSLIPNPSQFSSDESFNRIYKLLEKKNQDADANASQGGSLYKQVLGTIPKPNLSPQYANNEIRTSPVATNKIDLGSELGPDFDGYTNQVYGVSRTGGEVNGEAYDSMATAAEALWSKAMVDDQAGMRGKYLSDEQFGEIKRYAQKIDREKMAFKPLGQRLFAIKDPGSLVGKLAMLTPTNKNDGAKGALALLSPSNLSSAVASRLTPSTFAIDASKDNQLKAVRTGYPLDDPTNRMSGADIWQQNNCDSGGPVQETAKPEGVPFTVASNTNPCRREEVLSKITTCWLDNEDSCSFGGTNSAQTSNSSTSGTVGDIGESSDSVPCAEGSNDKGNVESRYTGSLRKDNPLIIKLCQVPDVGGRGNDTSGNNIEGGIVVNSRVSGAWVALGRAQKAAGINLTGSSFRLADSCGGGGDGSLCARPGTSMHQLGIAVDFSNMGSSGGSTSSCSGRKGAPGDPRWDWLFNNAQNYGIKQYSYEPWHWDTNQGANRCDNTSPAVF